ncbi:MAG: LTA synthase family protein [Lachnospiraceae bacterium]|nr:LTA synthase family protein [Lachnospiraceae bacterium]
MVKQLWQEWRAQIKRGRIVTAVVLWVISGILLGSGGSPLREKVTDYLAGEGSFGLPFAKGSDEYVQYFRPAYGSLQSVGVVVDWQQPEDADRPEYTALLLELAAEDGTVLRQAEVAFPALKQGAYTDVDMDVRLQHGKTYALRLTGQIDAAWQPELIVCSTDYKLSENRELAGPDTEPGLQLLTRYEYQNALRFSRWLWAMGLLLLAGIGIAVGLPANRRIRQIAAAVLLIAGPLVLGRSLEFLLPTNVLLPQAMKWNLGLMYLLELIVLLLTQSGRFTVVFSNVFLTVLYCANYFVHAFRGTYLMANELTAIRTAMDVVGNYHFHPTPDMTMCICMLGVFVCLGMCTGVKRNREEKTGKSGWIRFAVRHLATFVPGVALILVAGHLLLDTELILDHGFSYYSGFNQEYTYFFDGYLVGSMLNIKYNRIREPEGYSVRRVEEILEQNRVPEGAATEPAEDLPAENLPHVILIMNESFSDLRVNGNLELSAENLNVLHSLKDNTIQGYVHASVLGGGTANSEFEVFTGCAMGFLPDSYYAYEQAVTKPLHSMITNFKRAGYTTYSMHPERATNWKRNIIYQYLGFDRRLWKADFEGAEVIHSGVSDAATFRKVEELFENRQDGERLFVFDLTMQNHGYYSKTNVARTVEAVNVDCDEADIYLSLVYESDRAFGELIDYFAAQEEKVVICMFGDHQPKFESETFYEDIYRQTPGLTEEERKRNLYKTPFVIWANYDIDEAEGMEIGMSYLGVLLQRTAGVELTPFAHFLEEQMREYPIITINGYENKEGNYTNWSGENTEFLEYRMLQYNYLFDSNSVEWGF